MKIFKFRFLKIIIVFLLITFLGIGKFVLTTRNGTNSPLSNEKKEIELHKTYSFDGIVMLVMKNYLMVRPINSKDSNVERYISGAVGIYISIEKEADINYLDFNEGDIVIVEYDGTIMESDPPQITASSIKKDERNSYEKKDDIIIGSNIITKSDMQP